MVRLVSPKRDHVSRASFALLEVGVRRNLGSTQCSKERMRRKTASADKITGTSLNEKHAITVLKLGCHFTISDDSALVGDGHTGLPFSPTWRERGKVSRSSSLNIPSNLRGSRADETEEAAA